jgi:hypothetical protein
MFLFPSAAAAVRFCRRLFFDVGDEGVVFFAVIIIVIFFVVTFLEEEEEEVEEEDVVRVEAVPNIAFCIIVGVVVVVIVVLCSLFFRGKVKSG